MTQPSDLAAAFAATAAADPDGVAIRTKGDAVTLTWARLAEQVAGVAEGLRGLGVRRGDTVALLLTNSPEFHVFDIAALRIGAVPFSMYNTSTPDQIRYILRDTGAQVVVTEAALRPVLDDLDVETLLVVEDDFERLASQLPDEAAPLEVAPHDLATIVYTSGTTGPPKGVEISQRAIIEAVTTGKELIGIPDDAHLISYLPMAHVAERIFTHYMPILFGYTITCCPDPATVAMYLPESRPSIFWAPPRVWQKLKVVIEAAGITPDSPPEAIAELRHNLGLDRIVIGAVGAAPVQPSIVEFFMGLGIPLAEAWGLTECCALGTMNVPSSSKLGSVGRAAPGVELRLAEDGEILLRSNCLMVRYRNQPEATREAIDEDGWLHTGDVGTLDEEGFLRIVDRKKELIINAAGKNLSPANIEATLKAASGLIDQACVIGDDRPYIVALITVEPTAAAAISGPIEDAVSEAVAHANGQLSRVEQIKRFTILDEPWTPGDELTPTMKLRRKAIVTKYAQDIEALYEGDRRSLTPIDSAS